MLSAEHKKRKMKSSGYANIFLLVCFESALTGFTGGVEVEAGTLRGSPGQDL